ncbi:uncharacterized protein PSANT_02421 [Moesziomyces antarcticus]|nr:uncharacterized protein PSANT_02421 [Moesziomyces antarcticus]
MSTLDGAVPLGLGITKLRLWDEIHRAHCDEFRPHQAHLTDVQSQIGEAGRCKVILPARSSSAAPARSSTTEVDSQGVVLPPPPAKPRPSFRHPPPLVARLKAKARRARRKQHKAEHRRRLFLSHMVKMTNLVRRLTSRHPSPSQLSRQGSLHALSLLPEATGVDVSRFVDIVFDTDAQSSEITAPSEMSDQDLAHATRAEIETRIRMAGADVVVPKGVYRWMVASDFAKRWPSKVRHVRENPWKGLEHVWGLPSSGGGGEGPDREPVRWQSGPRSRFLRRNHAKVHEPTAAPGLETEPQQTGPRKSES